MKAYSKDYIRRNSPWETQKYHLEKGTYNGSDTLDYAREIEALKSILSKPLIKSKSEASYSSLNYETFTTDYYPYGNLEGQNKHKWKKTDLFLK